MEQIPGTLEIREVKDLNSSAWRGQEGNKQAVNEAGRESSIGCGGDCGTQRMPSLKGAMTSQLQTTSGL